MGMVQAVGMRSGNWRAVAWLALAAMLGQPAAVLAQSGGASDDVLRAGDEVRLTAPGRSELDQVIVLDAAGQASVAPIGPVQLGGLSVADAAGLLKQKLRLFHPTLDTVHLEMARAGTVRIYVIGGVSRKGALSFDAAPTLWDVLRAIGGPLENANLREVRVIREVNGAPQVTPMDLSGMMEGKDLPVFQMMDGDTLVIPVLQAGIPGVRAGEGVKVFGSVAVPTIVPIDEGTPLMDVLMMAGAPTAEAKRSQIQWVHHDGVKHRATMVDLDRFLLHGDEAGNPMVYPGDTINVEFSRPGWVRTVLPFVLGSAAALATIYLAYDQATSN